MATLFTVFVVFAWLLVAVAALEIVAALIWMVSDWSDML